MNDEGVSRGYKILIAVLVVMIIILGFGLYFLKNTKQGKELISSTKIKQKISKPVEVKKIEYKIPSASEITADKFAVVTEPSLGSYKALKYPKGNSEYYYKGKIVSVKEKENSIFEVNFRPVDTNKDIVFNMPKYPPIYDSSIYGMNIKEVFEKGFTDLSFVVKYGEDGKFWGWEIFSQIKKVDNENL